MNCSDIDPRKLTRHHRNGWELLLAHAICLVCPLLVHSYPPRSLQATSEWKLVGGGCSSLMRLINWKQTDLVFPKKPRSCCAVPEREAVKRACFFFFFLQPCQYDQPFLCQTCWRLDMHHPCSHILSSACHTRLRTERNSNCEWNCYLFSPGGKDHSKTPLMWLVLRRKLLKPDQEWTSWAALLRIK